MKFTATLSLVLALSASGLAIAQSDAMKGMDMKGMGMEKPAQGKTTKAMTHQAEGVVKSVDPAKGTVTLAHGPVKTLNWPAMTMRFKVKDNALFDKLAVNKNVAFEFAQQDSGYVITSVK